MIDQQLTTDLTIRPEIDSLFGSKSKYKNVSRHKRDAYRWRDGGFSPDILPQFRGSTPRDAERFFDNLNLYQNESTFHAPGPFPSSTRLSSRPDIEKAINLYVQTAYGLKDGKRWKREYEGPLKSLLWKYFVHDSQAKSLWRDLDSLHDMTDRSDKQVSDQVSPKAVLRALPSIGTRLIGGGGGTGPGLNPFKGNTQENAPGIGMGSPPPQQQPAPTQPPSPTQPSPTSPPPPTPGSGIQFGQTIPQEMIVVIIGAIVLLVLLPLFRK